MARKGENIFKRKDGRWEARYVKERDIKGKVIKYGYVYGKSYIDAKRKKEDAIENLKFTQLQKPNIDNTNFSTAIMNWLNNKTSIKDSTFYNYNSIITGKLIPYFNKTKIISISKQQICDFIKLLKNQELSSKRIKDILLLLNQFFEDSGIHMKFDYPSLSKKSISTFNDNEIHTIESDALNTEDIKKFAILLTLFTGMRIGELCALQWKDIDLENKIIHITKNIIRTKANMNDQSKTITKIDIPKTLSSVRDIPINDILISFLQKFKREDNKFLLTEREYYMTPNQYYYFYKKYIKSLRLTDYNFHAIRHTFATRSLSFGMDVKTLSVILGHTSIKITLDLYVHITEEEKRKQINKIPLLSG